MKTRIVHTDIWRDKWFRALSKDARELFLFCITNQYINLCGVFELSDDEINLWTKLDNLEAAKKEISPKVLFHDGWVFVRNASKLGGYSGSKNEVARTKEIQEIPEHVYRVFFTDEYPIDKVFSKKNTPINHKSEIINQKSESPISSLRNVLKEKGILKGGA